MSNGPEESNDQQPSTSYPTDGPFRLKATCKGHSQQLASVRFSPSGELLASASADCTWKLWRVSDGALVDKAASPDSNQQQAAGGGSKKQKAEAAKQKHSGGLSDVAWNCSSTYVATASDDLTAKLWDAETQKCITTYTGHTNYVVCCEFNPTGTVLATGSYDETIRFWDVRTARCIRQLPAHCDPITGIDFHPDGTVLASCSYDGMLRLWDTSTGHCCRTQAVDKEENPPLSNVKFSPNGRYLLLSSLSPALRLLSTKEGSVLRMYRGLTSKLYCSKATFISTLPRQAVATGSEDGSIFVWDLNTKEVLQQVPAGKAPPPPPPPAAVAEGEEGGDGNDADQEAEQQPTPTGHIGPVLSVAAHPTLPLLASAGLGDNCVRLWSAADADNDS